MDGGVEVEYDSSLRDGQRRREFEQDLWWRSWRNELHQSPWQKQTARVRAPELEGKDVEDEAVGIPVGGELTPARLATAMGQLLGRGSWPGWANKRRAFGCGEKWGGGTRPAEEARGHAVRYAPISAVVGVRQTPWGLQTGSDELRRDHLADLVFRDPSPSPRWWSLPLNWGRRIASRSRRLDRSPASPPPWKAFSASRPGPGGMRSARRGPATWTSESWARRRGLRRQECRVWAWSRDQSRPIRPSLHLPPSTCCSAEDGPSPSTCCSAVDGPSPSAVEAHRATPERKSLTVEAPWGRWAEERIGVRRAEPAGRRGCGPAVSAAQSSAPLPCQPWESESMSIAMRRNGPWEERNKDSADPSGRLAGCPARIWPMLFALASLQSCLWIKCCNVHRRASRSPARCSSAGARHGVAADSFTTLFGRYQLMSWQIVWRHSLSLSAFTGLKVRCGSQRARVALQGGHITSRETLPTRTFQCCSRTLSPSSSASLSHLVLNTTNSVRSCVRPSTVGRDPIWFAGFWCTDAPLLN